MGKIKVTRAKHAKRDRSQHFWRIEQDWRHTKRYFVYHSFATAILNADRLANLKHISPIGLRGFHIEGLS